MNQIDWQIKDSKLFKIYPTNSSSDHNQSTDDLIVEDTNMALSCDIYLQKDIKISYFASLVNYLLSIDKIIGPFKIDDSYQDNQIIILEDTSIVPKGGKVFYITEDKASLWNFLKENLSKLND